QPARLARGGHGGAVARVANRANRAQGTGLREPRSRNAGEEDRRDATVAGRGALSSAAGDAAGTRAGRRRGEAAVGREKSRDPRRTLLAEPGGLEAARGAR